MAHGVLVNFDNVCNSSDFTVQTVKRAFNVSAVLIHDTDVKRATNFFSPKNREFSGFTKEILTLNAKNML